MLHGVTIDSATTRDMDDALFAEMSGDNVRLYIAITNVADFVEVGGDEDVGAQERCFTRYFRAGSSSRSMLSSALTEEVCSLVPNKPKSVVVVELVVGPNGEVLDSTIRFDGFTSLAKLTYEEIPKALDGMHAWRQMLTEPIRAIHVATSRLFAARKAHGSVAFADPNAGMLASEDGTLEAVAENEFVGCMMVQEAMIAANQAIARFATTNDIPILYRNHEARIATPPRADVVAQLEQAPLLPTPHLSSLIERVDVLLGRAKYDAHVRGHYALCAPFYTHCTSPIRRYADLVTQRQLTAHLRGKRLPHTKDELIKIACHINDTIESAEAAQREHAKSRAMALSSRRIARRGYSKLEDGDFERAIRQLRLANLPPPTEFIEVVVQRIDERTITHRSVAYLLPSIVSSAVWEHVAIAVCTWFGESPEDAYSILKISKDLGLWSATVGEVEVSKDPARQTVSCVATLIDGNRVVTGPKCFAPGQKLAWHRAIAAVAIEHMYGQVPNTWIENDAQMTSMRETMTPKNAISELVELVQGFGKPPPLFNFEREGPDHKSTFKCTCRMGMFVTVGSGRDKQTAKGIAARSMLAKLKGAAGEEVRA